MNRRAFICGLSGPELTAGEADFLASTRPAGFILFARNVQSPEQVRQLIEAARGAAGGPMLSWWIRRAAACSASPRRTGRAIPLRAPSAACPRRRTPRRICARMMAHDLHALGFNTTAAPVLDVPVPGANNIIGDRAYGEDVETVAALGGAAAEGLLAGGILPVMKHIPGHGRAMADSHLALPVVKTALEDLQATDFAPFRALRHLPMAMTAHVVFTAVDADAPVTVSAKAIGEVIRGYIGFDGLLMSDDLSMQALSGTLEERARSSFSAGCDLALHCNGKMEEMATVADHLAVSGGCRLAPLRSRACAIEGAAAVFA